MNKEQFIQIAEEEGIASSDWKEDLWKLHKLLVRGLDPLLATEKSMCRGMILMEKRRGRQTLSNSLDYRFPRR